MFLSGALACFSAVGCDVGRDPYVYGGPAPQVLEVLAREAATAAPSALDPEGSSVVFSGSALRVRFDRYMDPQSMIRQSYCLQPDPAVVVGFEDCTQGVFTAPSYDPVTRTLSVHLDERLVAGNLYTLTLLAPREGTDFGFRAFDGVAFEANVSVSFTVAADVEPPEAVEGPAEAPDCADVAETIKTELSCLTCHVVDDETAPPAGLTLNREGLIAAIGRTAHGTSVGAAAHESQERPERFGSNMPLIDEKGSAGNSYLLYKLLAHEQALDGLADGETERLRASVVVGLPMPPPSEPARQFDSEGNPLPPREPASPEAMSLISRWISAGAPCAATD
ncbi:MAG: hypothetical protein IPM79_29635 [Polyangiaceae bacterium]|nr:hypothetical protein [Polyangiaceae bacterium]MBK8941654.1 hypothetical protein [Polyangiaceae bacterium]